MRASPTATPLSVAQATASPMETSGCAGFTGGFLPVATFQVVVRALRAATVAPIVEAKPIADHIFDPATTHSFVGLRRSSVCQVEQYPRPEADQPCGTEAAAASAATSRSGR